MYDLIGIGFGPAGISFSAALIESSVFGGNFSFTFLEKQQEVFWHAGLLIADTYINHHYLTDLAMPRNPKSDYTFVQYLHEKNRFYDFCYTENKVSRLEWSDYIRWASDKLNYYVKLDHEAEKIAYKESTNSLFIHTNQGVFEAKNLVLSVGLSPYLPSEFLPLLSDSFFHSCEFLEKIKVCIEGGAKRFLVIGSGQSAAEIVLYLDDAIDDAVIYSSHHSVGFKLKDTGHTSNSIYFPSEVDYFYYLDETARAKALRDSTSADYGNVSRQTSSELYAACYGNKVKRKESIHLLNRAAIASVEHRGSGYHVSFHDVYLGDYCRGIDVDAIVCCTGYRENISPHLLAEISHLYKKEKNGGYCVQRDYSLVPVADGLPAVYMLGMTESRFGISDTQSFSIMAIKAADAARSVLTRVMVNVA